MYLCHDQIKNKCTINPFTNVEVTGQLYFYMECQKCVNVWCEDVVQCKCFMSTGGGPCEKKTLKLHRTMKVK